MTQSPSILCICQARMTSVRLPKKVLMPLGGRPMLQFQLERLARSKRIDRIVVATTTDTDDDPIVDLCEHLNVAWFRGSHDDVLGRFAGCAEQFGGDVIVRTTADCPLIDPAVTDAVIDFFLTHPDRPDYANLNLNRFPRGLDSEIFWSRHLFTAHRQATSDYEREHVTPYIKTRPDTYILRYLDNPTATPYRWCVDEDADYRLVQKLVEKLGPDPTGFTWEDCVRVMEQNPSWAGINAEVMQRSH